MKDHLPLWLHEWLGVITPLAQVLLILAAAWLLRTIVRTALERFRERYAMPAELAISGRRVASTIINVGALLLALQVLGVSGTVLWTAFTGFAAVGAVAFFAAWSVLSNIFCAMLIFTTRPFRLHDHIELLENGEKPGLKGRVVDINLIYTTLREVDPAHDGAVLQIPNSLFFQRTTRCWGSGDVPATWQPSSEAR